MFNQWIHGSRSPILSRFKDLGPCKPSPRMMVLEVKVNIILDDLPAKSLPPVKTGAGTQSLSFCIVALVAIDECWCGL